MWPLSDYVCRHSCLRYKFYIKKLSININAYATIMHSDLKRNKYAKPKKTKKNPTFFRLVGKCFESYDGRFEFPFPLAASVALHLLRGGGIERPSIVFRAGSLLVR